MIDGRLSRGSPPLKLTERQDRIALGAGPWTRADYLTSATAQAIDAAWQRASQWSLAAWRRRQEKRRRDEVEA